MTRNQDNKMTLIERLMNPAWVHGPGQYDEPILEKEMTVNDMRQAAAEIERLRAALMPFGGEKLPQSRRTEIGYDRNGLRCAMSPLRLAHANARLALSSHHQGTPHAD